jgi:outer membrane immunogenic protein
MSRLKPFELIGQRMHVARMAVAVCATLAVPLADRALAADMLGDTGLRGSLAPIGYIRWDGWQFGVQAGFANMETQGFNTTNGPVFGGFLGYNGQWEQLVLGVDVGYKYASVLDASVETARFKLNDYATARVRAGYAMGQFLPYAFVGAAVGRFNYANLNIGTGTFVGKDNALDGGFVAGLGMDWAVTPAIFVRAEWEFVAFAGFDNTLAQVNSGSLGIGLRF